MQNDCSAVQTVTGMVAPIDKNSSIEQNFRSVITNVINSFKSNFFTQTVVTKKNNLNAIL